MKKENNILGVGNNAGEQNFLKKETYKENEIKNKQKASEIYNNYSNNSNILTKEMISDLLGIDNNILEQYNSIKEQIEKIQKKLIGKLKKIENCNQCNLNKNEIINNIKEEINSKYYGILFRRTFNKNTGEPLIPSDIVDKKINLTIKDKICNKFDYLFEKHKNNQMKFFNFSKSFNSCFKLNNFIWLFLCFSNK